MCASWEVGVSVTHQDIHTIRLAAVGRSSAWDQPESGSGTFKRGHRPARRPTQGQTENQRCSDPQGQDYWECSYHASSYQRIDPNVPPTQADLIPLEDTDEMREFYQETCGNFVRQTSRSVNDLFRAVLRAFTASF